MSDKRILCVGLCVLDIIHVCTEYPQEDTDKRCLNGYWQRGGNASNNCSVLSKLGANSEFLGMASTAPAFQFLYEDCIQRNIDIRNCPKTEMDPPFSSVLLVKTKGTRTIIHSNPGFPILRYEDFKKLNLYDYSWIHFEGRNVEETKQMIALIRSFNEKEKRSIQISVELEKLNKDLFILAMRADLVFVGKDIAQHMGWYTAKEAVYNSLQIISDLRAKENAFEWHSQLMIICPWGSVCSDALDVSKNEYYTLKAVSVENIVDSLGAGDTFVAAVIFAINNLNKNLREAVDYGNHVAAFKIQHRGYDCLESFKFPI